MPNIQPAFTVKLTITRLNYISNTKMCIFICNKTESNTKFLLLTFSEVFKYLKTTKVAFEVKIHVQNLWYKIP